MSTAEAMPVESDLTDLLTHISDDILGLDEGSKIVSVDFQRLGDTGKLIVNLEAGKWGEEILGVVDIFTDVDTSTVVEFDLGGKISDQLDDLASEILSRLKATANPDDAPAFIFLNDVAHDILKGKLIDDLSDQITEIAFSLDVDFGDLTDTVIPNLKSYFESDLFANATEELVSTYATFGLSAVLNEVSDVFAISDNFTNILESVLGGFLRDGVSDIVDDYLFDDRQPDRFDADQFLESVSGAIFDNLLIDDIEDEIFDDLLGLDGGGVLETKLTEFLSAGTRVAFVEAIDQAVGFFAGDITAFEFEPLLNGFNVSGLLSGLFSKVTGEALADLVVEIDSFGEAQLSSLGSTLAASALGEPIGLFIGNAVGTVFGNAIGTAVGSTVFQALGAALGAGIGAIAGSFVYEALDWVTGGWLGEFIDDLFNLSGSPQAFRPVAITAEGAVSAYTRFDYSKDTEAELRQAVDQMRSVYLEQMRDIFEYLGEDLEYEGPSLITFSYKQKHPPHTFNVYVNNNESALIGYGNDRGVLVTKAVAYTLNRSIIDDEGLRGEAFEAWKADVIDASGWVALASQDSLQSLDAYFRVADFAEAYLEDPEPFDSLMRDVSKAASASVLRDYLLALEMGLLEPTLENKTVEISGPVGRTWIDITGYNQASFPDVDYTAEALGHDDVTLATGGLFIADQAVTVRALDEAVRFYGSHDGDKFFGGTANDYVWSVGGDGNIIRGEGGNDTLRGSYGYDNIRGGEGDDKIDGEEGDDILSGDSGDDLIAPGSGADILNGGSGIDTIDYRSADGVGVNLLQGYGFFGDAAGDTYVFFENIEGSSARDYLTGNHSDNIIIGGAGMDVMYGKGGDDTFAVDNSYDAVIEEAGEGYDNVFSSADYHIDDNQEIESAILTGNATILRGSNSDNQLIGNDFVNVLEGNGGTDYLLGLGGDDIFQVSKESTDTDLDVFGDFEGAGVVGGDRIALSAAEWGADGVVYQVSQTSFIVATAQNTNQQQFIIANLTAPQTDLIAGDDYYFG